MLSDQVYFWEYLFVAISTTGGERLIRSHLLARFFFELRGNSN